MIVAEVAFKVASVGDIQMYNNRTGFVKNFGQKNSRAIGNKVDHILSQCSGTIKAEMVLGISIREFLLYVNKDRGVRLA